MFKYKCFQKSQITFNQRNQVTIYAFKPGTFCRVYFSIISLSGILLVGCAANRNIGISNNNIRLINRQLMSSDSDPFTIEVNKQEKAGLMIIENLDFDYGLLEFDLKGENSPGTSFVGLAFNIRNDSTYELVYFRPFNFHAESREARGHSVQYVSHPEYPWHRLRTEHPGKYESLFQEPPAAEEWFTIRLRIEPDYITAVDNQSRETLLRVTRLHKTESKKIGFWTGTNSRGSFRNLNLVRVGHK